MNPVLILSHNCLELTKKCVESVRAQDIETSLLIFDNGSTDGTREWLETIDGSVVGNTKNTAVWKESSNCGVSKGWNFGLNTIFKWWINKDHVLVLNNDTILPPWFYRTLLSHEGPFITGVSVGSMDEIASPPPRKDLAPCPDFSAFLIRRECWEKVGLFDEQMKFYASDNDYHVRARRAGLPLMNAGVPFYHERSSTLKQSSPEERREIESQADADRQAFKALYGCMPWEPEYAELFK